MLLRHDFLDGSFDVVAVTESWLKPCIPDSFISSKGFNVERKDRMTLRQEGNNGSAKVKSGGGICLYLKNDMIYEIVNPIKNDCNDLKWLCVKTSRGGGKKQVIMVMYRPPNCNPNRATELIRESLVFLNDFHRNSEHILIGDLNFNYKNNKCPHVKNNQVS